MDHGESCVHKHLIQNILENMHVILQNPNKSLSKEYEVLVQLLMERKTESNVLIQFLRRLRDSATLLGKDHEQLVGSLLHLDWVSRDQTFIAEYQSLLLNLVSAHPYYLRACVRMLVKNFFPGDCNTLTVGCTREKDDACFIQVHLLLRALAQIVPMTNTVLLQFLSDSFPYLSREVYIHELFTRNLIQLVQYMPDLRPNILELLIDRMLRLDVRAPRKEIVKIEVSSEDDEIQFFRMESAFDSCHEMEQLNEKLEKTRGIEMKQTMNHKEAERLDVMMDLTMTFIHQICYPSGSFDWETTKKLYKEMLYVFDKLIFSTHASCHAQFLLLYICSFKQPLWEGFIDYLWKKVTTPMTQSIYRQAAAGYIGSFLARATYVNISLIKVVLEMMIRWIHEYLDQMGTDSIHADLAHHAPFYGVCQAVFYVFCFHHRQLLEIHKGYKWAESLNFQRIITSKLNPLHMCLPLICRTFASVVSCFRLYQLAFCDTIIERNRRNNLNSSDVRLDAFFPFDPYLLKKSGCWIKPLYREYDGIVSDKVNKDSEATDDFLLADECRDRESCAVFSTSRDSTLDLLEYGTSPGFKNM